MFNKNKFIKTNQSQLKIKSKETILILTCLLFFFSNTAYTKSPITVSAEIDKKTVTTGDIITYTIILKHELGLILTTPSFDEIDMFDIVKRITSKPRITSKDIIEQKYSIKLRADKVGTYSIPPVKVLFKLKQKKNGEYISGEIVTQKTSIEVASILRLQGEPTDIKGIKDIIKVEKKWKPWFFWGLNALLLIITLYLLWKYRKVKHSNITEKPPILPSHILALSELDILKNKGFLERGNAREHFFELSEIFRRYLASRFLFPASDWTTEEISEYFKKEEKIEHALKSEANRILKKSDLIKFAKAKALPGKDEIESVRVFIETTQENLSLGLYPN
jgi:hypothetical protein